MRYARLKRKAALLISSLILASALAGCSGGSENGGASGTDGGTADAAKDTAVPEAEPAASDSEEPVTIRVCWWGNQTRNNNTTKALEMYEKLNPNVNFEIEFTNWDGYWNKLATQAAGGNMADIVQIDYAYVRQYLENNQFADLAPFIESGIIDMADVNPTLVEAGMADGITFGVPCGTNCKALLVNEDLVREAGVTVPDQPTWEELIELGRQVTAATGAKITFPTVTEQTMLFLARAHGETMFSEDGKSLGMKDDTVLLRYFNLLDTMLEEEIIIPPEITAESMTNQYNLFAAEKTWAELVDSNTITSTIALCQEDVNFGIYKYPTEADAKQQNIYIKPSMYWTVAETSRVKEEAAKVINYLTNDQEVNREALKGERGVPISSSVSAAIEPIVDETTARIMSYVNDTAKSATRIDPPYPSSSAEVAKLVSDVSDKVLYREITPEEAVQEFRQQAEGILKR